MNGLATDSTLNDENSSEEPFPKEAESPLVPNRLVRAVAWLHPAHDAMMLDKIRHQNHIVRKQVKSMVAETGADMGEDDMGDLSVGNEIHNHYTSQQESKGASTFGKLLATGLLGAGLGVGGVLLGNWLAGQDKDTDTDTTVEMGLGRIKDYLKPNE